jgi:hypothetical protein
MGTLLFSYLFYTGFKKGIAFLTGGLFFGNKGMASMKKDVEIKPINKKVEDKEIIIESDQESVSKDKVIVVKTDVEEKRSFPEPPDWSVYDAPTVLDASRMSAHSERKVMRGLQEALASEVVLNVESSNDGNDSVERDAFSNLEERTV